MDVIIRNTKDGTGATITSANQLLVRAEIHALQHHVSRHEGRTFQVIGITDTLTAATITVLHIKNTDTNRFLVINDIHSQIVDQSATLPVVTDYFQFGFGTTGSSGSTATIVNMNRSSGVVASVTALHSTPSSSGSFVEHDRWYPTADGDIVELQTEGSPILGLNDTWESRIVSTSNAGIAYTRVTFMMIAF